MTPDISVIIPVYNVEQYLRDCIESVISQSKKEIEIILVDDGSTDNSGKICDEYAFHYERVKVIHKKNAGLGYARNSGLDIAIGKYIFFLDSDDWMPPETLSYLFSFAEENKADLVCFPFYYVNDRTFSEYNEDSIIIKRYDTFDALKNYFSGGGNVSSTAWSKFYSRSIWNDLRFSNTPIHEDAEIIHLILDSAKNIFFTSRRCYVQYIRPVSIMQSPIKKKNFFSIVCADNHLRFCKEKYPELIDFAMMEKIVRQYILFDRIEKEKVKKEFYDEYFSLKREIKTNLLNLPVSLRTNLTIKDIYIRFLHPVYYRISFFVKTITSLPARCIMKIIKILKRLA